MRCIGKPVDEFGGGGEGVIGDASLVDTKFGMHICHFTSSCLLFCIIYIVSVPDSVTSTIKEKIRC